MARLRRKERPYKISNASFLVAELPISPLFLAMGHMVTMNPQEGYIFSVPGQGMLCDRFLFDNNETTHKGK